jgi:hypothetical protein
MFSPVNWLSVAGTRVAAQEGWRTSLTGWRYDKIAEENADTQPRISGLV